MLLDVAAAVKCGGVRPARDLNSYYPVNDQAPRAPVNRSGSSSSLDLRLIDQLRVDGGALFTAVLIAPVNCQVIWSVVQSLA